MNRKIFILWFTLCHVIYRVRWSSTDTSTIVWACPELLQDTTVYRIHVSIYHQDKRKWLSASHFVTELWMSENTHSTIFQNKNVHLQHCVIQWIKQHNISERKMTLCLSVQYQFHHTGNCSLPYWIVYDETWWQYSRLLLTLKNCTYLKIWSHCRCGMYTRSGQWRHSINISMDKLHFSG